MGLPLSVILTPPASPSRKVSISIGLDGPRLVRLERSREQVFPIGLREHPDGLFGC